MKRLATKRRRKSPRIVAKLDFTDEGQRRLHELIARMHGGRHPTLRALGIRQIANVLHEAVQWLGSTGPIYAVVTWHGDGLGLNWQDAASEAQARAILNALN